MTAARRGRLVERLGRLGLDPDVGWVDVVRAVRALPYGRPSSGDPDTVLAEGRGTCSSKHELVRALLADGWPELDVTVTHRVYRVTWEAAHALFGPAVAASVPAGGLTDVHTYLIVRTPDGRVLSVDATIASDEPWDGRTSMALACGPGVDHPGGDDPAATKARLVAEHCDPDLREPFLAALAARPERDPTLGP